MQCSTILNGVLIGAGDSLQDRDAGVGNRGRGREYAIPRPVTIPTLFSLVVDLALCIMHFEELIFYRICYC